MPRATSQGEYFTSLTFCHSTAMSFHPLKKMHILTGLHSAVLCLFVSVLPSRASNSAHLPNVTTDPASCNTKHLLSYHFPVIITALSAPCTNSFLLMLLVVFFHRNSLREPKFLHSLKKKVKMFEYNIKMLC